MGGGMTFTAVESTQMSTGEIFGKTLGEIGLKDKRVVAITADLAKSTKIGDFMKNCPERFFNVGIAEQNMTGVAAGMAKCGLIPFIAAFAVFASLRCADQVHTDICYQNQNVKIIGSHAGTSFGQAGSTHHALMDLAVMRSFPHMTVIVPADGYETANAVTAAYENDGPFYIRINRGFDMVLYKDTNYGYELGKAIKVYDGGDKDCDVTLIACGSCVYQSLQAAQILENDYKIKADVLNMHTIKPIDKDAIISAVEKTRRIITIEDHSIIGGLGAAVSEVIAESGKACSFRRLGLQDKFSALGFQEDLLADNGIDANGIVAKVVDMMKHSTVVEIDKDGVKTTAVKFDDRNFEVDVNWDDEV